MVSVHQLGSGKPAMLFFLVWTRGKGGGVWPPTDTSSFRQRRRTTQWPLCSLWTTGSWTSS